MLEEKNVELQQEEQEEQDGQELEQTLGEEEINLIIENLRLEQKFPLAIVASVGAAIVMAILWAAITVATEYQIGYMAVAVGLVVGFAVRFAGKGIDRIYGIIGAAGALFGCVLGNFLSNVGFLSLDPEFGLTYFEALTVLLLNMGLTIEIMIDTFSPIDLVFYGIAIYEGYHFSFRKIEI